ncbi:malate dehydrogenase [Holospora elegans E1]|uniref:Malate dehydrogenase n=1 Tax=Holospora elegans E1 TaxID=1427503 RepID=A0A023E0G2_9PROT|nr:hypothetical protein [Holospora elegans]GAJ46497.1 malate dehydrogenase [Holospora elegans E1]
MKSVGIIGVGQIGGTLAHMVLQHRIPVRLGLYDVNEDALQGKVWDLEEASIIGKFEGNLEIVSSLEKFESFDVLVITAGRFRTPGMSRADLLKENSEILQSIAKKIENFKGVVVIVTNPVDLMARFFSDLHPLPSSRILGMAGVLDEGRMAYHIKAFSGLKGQSVRPCVIGPHSDRMVPLQAIKVGPGNLQDIVQFSQEQKNSIDQNTRFGGGRIIEKLKLGSAFYGPASACFRMILKPFGVTTRSFDLLYSDGNKRNDSWHREVKFFFGWPVILGKEGVKKK